MGVMVLRIQLSSATSGRSDCRKMGRALGVEPQGPEKSAATSKLSFPQRRAVVNRGHGMVVGHKEEALMLLLHVEILPDGPENNCPDEAGPRAECRKGTFMENLLKTLNEKNPPSRGRWGRF